VATDNEEANKSANGDANDQGGADQGGAGEPLPGGRGRDGDTIALMPSQVERVCRSLKAGSQLHLDIFSKDTMSSGPCRG